MVHLNFVLLQVTTQNLVWMTLALLFFFLWAFKRPIVKFFELITPLQAEPQEYSCDEADPNIFTNKMDTTMKIRIHHNVKGDKDKALFVASLPIFLAKKKWYMSDNTPRNFDFSIPQIVKNEEKGVHELLITKSSASKWEDIQRPILEFLFIHLNKMYDWKYEKQLVLIQPSRNRNYIQIHLRIETKNVLDLGRKLIALRGMVSSIGSEGGVPLCMDFDGHYDFNLEKAQAFSWSELLPKIKQIFYEHFPSGVEFKIMPQEPSRGGYGKDIYEVDFEFNGHQFEEHDY